MSLKQCFLLICFGYLLSQFLTYAINDCQFYSENDYCRDRTVSILGDLNIAVPISLHNQKEDKFCSDISISGFQTAIAIEWIVQILNGNYSGSTSFIPGVKLGYKIYDDCGLPSRTSSFLTETLHKSTLTDLQECTNSSLTTNPFAGVMTISSPASSSKSMQISLPDVPVISVNYFDANYENSYGAFFGHNSMEMEIKVILEFMKKNSWNFVGVVYTQDTVGREYLAELLKQTVGYNNCYLQLALSDTNVKDVVEDLIKEQNNFAEDESFGVLYLGSSNEAVGFLQHIQVAQHSIASKLMILFPSGVGACSEIKVTIQKMMNDVFFISPHKMILNDFKDYFQNAIDSNSDKYKPWITDYIKRMCMIRQKDSCTTEDIMGIFRQEYQIDNSVAAMITFAQALKQMHNLYCNGQEGVCDRLTDNLNQTPLFLKNSSVSLYTDISLSALLSSTSALGFFNENVMTLGLQEYNINLFKQNDEKSIGRYFNGQLHLDWTTYTKTESICKIDTNIKCTRCIESESLQFGYTPGDIYILGLFSIHQDASNSVGENAVFKCGDFRTATTAIITVSAFLESVKTLRSKTGINFGAIALDDCYNELNISVLLTELFTGQRVLHDKNTNSPIDFSKVVAVVGALSSRVTLRVADIMSSLHIPMVSYGASATYLDNRIRYPYFLRTVPSDALQIEGMVKVLSTLNIKYVGALYIDDAYGASGIQGLVSEAKSSKICVSNPQIVTEDTSNSRIKEILQEDYYKGVKVITMFSFDTIVKKIIGEHALGDDSHNVMSNYAPIFISSEGWGTSHELANKESAGSLIFTTDSSKQVSSWFGTYLRSLSPSNTTENPWLYRFWEDHFECYMPLSFEKRYTKRCLMDSKLSSDIVISLASDQRTIHTEIAVAAVVYAYKNTCNSNECLKRTKVSASKWTQDIKNTNIPIADGTNFKPFKNDNNGNLGFTIHNIQKQANSYSYIKVGTYNGTLSLQEQNLRFYDSIGKEIPLPSVKCPITAHCKDICVVSTSYSEPTTSPTAVVEDTSMDYLAIALGTLAGLLFLVVLLLIIIVFKAIRAKDVQKVVENSHISMEHLAVPIHHRSNRSLNGIYHEAHSIHSSLNDIRAHINGGFHSDNESFKQPPRSISSGIVAGSSSDSAGSRIMYSDMSQITSNNAVGNKYLHLVDSSDGSNTSLKSLTRRVLQPHATEDVQTNELNVDANLTYLSANDLVMTEEDEAKSNNDKNREGKDFEKMQIEPTSEDVTPNESRDIVTPPEYPINGNINGMKRPQTLPGIQPVLLSPHNSNVTIHGVTYQTTPSTNLYTNDMYLMPVADSLPTYEQHVLQQKLQKERLLHDNNPSPSTYSNVPLTSPQYNHKGAMPATITSPQQGPNQRFNGVHSLSSSSSVGSPSPSVISLSPAQKEALLNRILTENPGYFNTPNSINLQSPVFAVQSPQPNSTVVGNIILSSPQPNNTTNGTVNRNIILTPPQPNTITNGTVNRNIILASPQLNMLTNTNVIELQQPSNNLAEIHSSNGPIEMEDTEEVMI